jgi:hypothetical protein
MNALETKSNSSALNDEECYFSASSIMDKAFFFCYCFFVDDRTLGLAFFLPSPGDQAGLWASIGNRAAL